MNLLTKEECTEALNHIIYCDRYDRGLSYLSDAYRNDISILSKLIDEHFDNPPLNYEEIEEGKWYWHNKLKMWMKILNKDVCTAPFYVMENEYGYLLFEENCFFRKEVQE